MLTSVRILLLASTRYWLVVPVQRSTIIINSTSTSPLGYFWDVLLTPKTNELLLLHSGIVHLDHGNGYGLWINLNLLKGLCKKSRQYS